MLIERAQKGSKKEEEGRRKRKQQEEEKKKWKKRREEGKRATHSQEEKSRNGQKYMRKRAKMGNVENLEHLEKKVKNFGKRVCRFSAITRDVPVSRQKPLWA